jgi:hypothetical protein
MRKSLIGLSALLISCTGYDNSEQQHENRYLLLKKQQSIEEQKKFKAPLSLPRERSIDKYLKK